MFVYMRVIVPFFYSNSQYEITLSYTPKGEKENEMKNTKCSSYASSILFI